MNTELLLALAVILAFPILILRYLSKSHRELMRLHQTIAMAADIHAETMRAMNDKTIDILEESTRKLEELTEFTKNISAVMDVIERYKLPTKKEQEMLDRIAIDNEVSDGIRRRR